MKSEFIFLALPLAATLGNVFFAVFFCLPHRTNSQPLVHQQHVAAGAGAASIMDRCIGLTGEQCQAAVPSAFEASTTEDADTDEDEEEEDPMLQKMPGYDFKAYVRADVSTFYGEEPGSRTERVPKYTGQAAKFINMSPDPVELYWVGDDGVAVSNSLVPAWSSSGPASYPGHRFVFAEPGRPDRILCRFLVRRGTSVHYCDPFTPNDKRDHSCGKYEPEMRSLDELSEEDRVQYDAHAFNLKFGRDYKNFTGGSEWLSMYPRNPPKHKIWRADYFGQEHVVTTAETHFATIPENLTATAGGSKLSAAEMGRDYDPMSAYREPGTMNMTLKAISCAPRAFEIRNFLSDAEADHLLDVIRTRDLERSGVGSSGENQVSEVRTSRTTWIKRSTDPILNAIYRRGADALRMDEALLRHRLDGELDDERERLLKKRAINEELQVVHYDVGQQYTAHHDFGYPKAGQPDSPARSINLCLYLNDVPAGGETSFPRWRNGETSEAINVKPEKGKAMIFYMTNPDGNLDDLTHHAALPVVEGEKWFSNLWIYDPVRL